jgi:hypothetical protein
MDDLRRLVLTKFKEILELESFVDGVRFTILGSMDVLFEGVSEERIPILIQELGEQLAELGMRLSSYPGRPDILCAMQEEDENGLRSEEAIQETDTGSDSEDVGYSIRKSK